MTEAIDSAYTEFLSERRRRIVDLVSEAAEAAGRDPDEIMICAVSKTVGPDAVRAAHEVGYTAFAENRPQELERKIRDLSCDPACADIAWHLIGNLQENKINHVLACKPVLIHSVAQPHLAEALSKRAASQGLCQPVLLEINISGEESKSGMTADEVRAAAPELAGLAGISIRGLMTMAPQGDAAAAKATFAGLRLLRDELNGREDIGFHLTELSMGMSEDFQEAIGQGATIIRLGRVVFDPAFPL